MTDSKHIKPKAVSALSPGELEGKTALVTGGGGVIGPAYARALAEAGAAVALVDIDAGKAQRAAKKLCDDGFRVQGWQADVGVKADIESKSKV